MGQLSSLGIVNAEAYAPARQDPDSVRKLCLEDSTVAEVVSNESVATRYMNSKKQTPQAIQARTYAKA